MSVAPGFEQRLGQCLDAVDGNQKALARLGDVSDATLINWGRGQGVRPKKLAAFAKNIGVSLRWLKDGVGDAADALRPLRSHQGKSKGFQSPVRLARDATGMSLKELAARTGYPLDYLAKVETGALQASEGAIDALCRELPSLSKEELMRGSDSPSIISETEATYGATTKLRLPPGISGRYVPLLSMAQAGGYDAGHDDGYYDYGTVFAPNVDDRQAFAIKVSGNSMEPRLFEGDVVVCSPAKELVNGAAAVIRTKSDQAFIKFWFRVQDTVILESANPDYPALTFPIQEIAGAWPIIMRTEAGMILKQTH